MERAVIMMSGGLSSAVSAWIARQEHRVALLHVSFGQRSAESEQRAFDDLAGALNAEKAETIDCSTFARIGLSARVADHAPITDARTLGESEGPADTHQPGLMMMLLGLGHAWARTVGARHLFVGACENLGPPAPPTAQLHPDIRREFFQIASHLIDPVGPRTAPPVQIQTPVIDLSLEDIIRLGLHLDAPLGRTWSCLDAGHEPCKACYGCVTRAHAFARAGIADPLVPGQRPVHQPPHPAAVASSESGESVNSRW